MYNGKDKVRAVARGRRTLKQGVTWQPKCKGHGTDRCKVYVTSEEGSMCPVDVGKKAVRVGFNATVYIGKKDKNPDNKFIAIVGELDHCVVSP